jgi:uncharacterized protein DUF2721
MSVADNPFAVLTAVVAPAILTNACSVLCLGTGNRLARVVDRTRAITASLATLNATSREYKLQTSQLDRQRARAHLLLRALRSFYACLGSFASTALLSIAGSALTVYDQELAFRVTALVAFAVGGFGVVTLVTGCALMVRETRFAVQNLDEEAEVACSATVSPHRPS